MSVKKDNQVHPATVKKHLVDEETENLSQSMFDVTLREKTLFQRLVLVARLPNGLSNRTELTAHYERLNLHLSKQFMFDTTTGLLLLYTSCLLHIIESSREVRVAVMEDLVKLQQSSDCTMLEAPKIVFMEHSPHSRLFQQWSYKVLNVAVDPDSGTKETEEEPIEKLVHKVLSSVKTIAKHLEQAKKDDTASSLNEFAISPNNLVKLSVREELLTPQQYLRLYNSPYIYIQQRYWTSMLQGTKSFYFIYIRSLFPLAFDLH